MGRIACHVLLSSLLSMCSYAQTRYQLFDAGAFGNHDAAPMGVNNQGQIVGDSDPTGPSFYWDFVRGMTEIKADGNPTRVSGINNNGQVVGSTVNGIGKGFVWTTNKGVTFCEGTGLFWTNSAHGINAQGHVAGGYSNNVSSHAGLWTATNGWRDLGTTEYGDTSGTGINDYDQVTGFTMVGGGYRRPIIWSELSGMQVIDVPVGYVSGVGRFINNSGQIGGNLVTDLSTSVGFVRDTDGTLRLMRPNSGSVISTVDGLNQNGEAVGTFYGSSGLSTFVYTKERGFQDLQNLLDDSGAGYRLFGRAAVSDNGLIASMAQVTGYSHLHTVLLVPVVPEPMTGVTLATLLPFGFFLRRRRNR